VFGTAPFVLLCPRCGGGIGFLEGDFRTLRCACGYAAHASPAGIFVLGRSTSQATDASLLINQTESFDRGLRYNRFMWSKLVGEIVELAGKNSGGVFLDVGSGEGNYAVQFAGSYDTYIGLEPSDLPPSRMVPEALRGNPRALLIQNDPEKALPLAPASVDVAWLIGSYDHIRDDARARVVRELRSILKPAGKCVIVMTNDDFWLKRVLRAIGLRRLLPRDSDHHCSHSPARLIAELNDAGGPWQVESISAAEFYIPNVAVLRRTLFQIPGLMRIGNAFMKILCRLVGVRHPGSYMIVTVRKPAAERT
jgi:SAM-dependent methyltransferase